MRLSLVTSVKCRRRQPSGPNGQIVAEQPIAKLTGGPDERIRDRLAVAELWPCVT
jgi:hypothetical protein